MDSSFVLVKVHADVQGVLGLLDQPGTPDLSELRIFLLHVEFALRRLNPAVTQRLDVALLRGVREVLLALHELVQNISGKKQLWPTMPKDKWGRRGWKEKHCMCEIKSQLQQQLQAMMPDLLVGADPELRAALEFLSEARLVEAEDLGGEEWKVDTGELSKSEVYLRGMGRGWSGITAAGSYCGTQVAVKMPHGDQAQLLAADARKIAAFEGEVAQLFRLHHPNIVTCFGGIGADHNGKHLFYVVMEILNVTLTEEISRPDTPLRRSREERCRLCLDTCRGVLFMHSLQPEPILHRDLNTMNVMLDSHRTVKVIDFGATREEAAAGSAAGSLLLREEWVAPEVQSGAAAVSMSSDLYALALCCLCLASVAPLGRYSPLQANLPKVEDAMAKTGLPPPLVEAVLRGVMLPPAQRPSAGELVMVLEAARDALAAGPCARSPSSAHGPAPQGSFRRTNSIGAGEGAAEKELERERRAHAATQKRLEEAVREREAGEREAGALREEADREREARAQAESDAKDARREAERQRAQRGEAERKLEEERRRRERAEAALAAEADQAEGARRGEREAGEQLRALQGEAGAGLSSLKEQLAQLEERCRRAEAQREAEAQRAAEERRVLEGAGRRQHLEAARLKAELERLRRKAGLDAVGEEEAKRAAAGSFRSHRSASGQSSRGGSGGEEAEAVSPGGSFGSFRSDPDSSPLASARPALMSRAGSEQSLGSSSGADKDTSPRAGSSGRFVALPPQATTSRFKPRPKGRDDPNPA